MPTLLQDIIHITEDRTSGSVALLDKLLTAIHKSGSQKLTREELDYLKSFADRQSQFVIIGHLVNTLTHSGKQNLQAVTRSYRNQWNQVTEGVITQACQTLEGTQSLLVHSHSETIVSFLKRYTKENPGARIYQTISKPEKEGLIQLERLTSAGCEVDIVDDNPGKALLDSIETFVSGADVLGVQTFINKKGTLWLAQRIRERDKAVYVLADPRKKVTDTLKYGLILASLRDDFEEVPNTLVNEFITGV